MAWLRGEGAEGLMHGTRRYPDAVAIPGKAPQAALKASSWVCAGPTSDEAVWAIEGRMSETG